MEMLFFMFRQVLILYFSTKYAISVAWWFVSL